jgi:hypothetical protein
MPDISMCDGEGCKKRETCYRFTATPDRRQAYFKHPPVKEDGKCAYFWDKNGEITTDD